MDLDATGLAQALRNALKHINIYSIELPAWLRAKKDFRGNPCKDLKDFINLSGENQEQTYYNFLVLKRNARRIKFWQKTVEEKSGKDQLFAEHGVFLFLSPGQRILSNGIHLSQGCELLLCLDKG